MNGLINLYGHDGFKVWLCPEKITVFGLDPGPKLFVLCDGREYAVSIDVEKQFEMVKKVMDQLYKPTIRVEGQP